MAELQDESQDINGNASFRLLLSAVEDDDIDAMNKLLREKVFSEDELQQATLESASLGNFSTLTRLLETPAVHVNVMDEGCTPLLEAVKKGNRDMAKYLLDLGADPNLASGHFKRSPLYEASKRSQMKLCELLLAKGADCNQADKGWITPLMMAAGQSDSAIASLLLRSGALINAKDMHGESALYKAVAQGAYEMVDLLLRRGADCNFRTSERFGNTLLHVAAQRNDHAIVSALLKYGAQKDVRNWIKQTPYDQALCQGHLEVVNVFLEAGVDIQEPDRFGDTPLIKATHYGFHGIVSSLIEHGANVNQTNVHMETALHKAIMAMSFPSVDALIGAGANANAQAFGGSTPLHMAAGLPCSSNTYNILVALLRRGGDVNLRGRQARDATWVALDKGLLPTARLLVEAGSSLNTLHYYLHVERMLSVDPAAGGEALSPTDPASIRHWLLQAVRNPRSLQDLSCISTRACLGAALLHKAYKLPVPKTMQDKVNYYHLEKVKPLFRDTE